MLKNDLGKHNFIVFEGGEACGKSTQIFLLQKKLGEESGAVFTREPGGTDLANQIREIIVTGDKDKMSAKTELALIYAARNENLEKVIFPALDKGKMVISDRFYLSSFVYQGFARGLDLGLITKFNDLFLKDFKPTITFLFDLDVKTAQERVSLRKNSDERFEQFDKGFHQKIRDGFLFFAKKDKKIKIIDASKSPEFIHQKILQELKREGLFSNFLA